MKKRNKINYIIIFSVLFSVLFLFSITQAFIGPSTQSPGTGGGALQVDANGNLVVTEYVISDGSSLIFQPSSGVVGIGTETPQTLLDVSGIITGTSFTGIGTNLTAIDPQNFIAGSAFNAGNYAVQGSLAIGTVTLTAPTNGLYVVGRIGVGTNSATNGEIEIAASGSPTLAFNNTGGGGGSEMAIRVNGENFEIIEPEDSNRVAYRISEATASTFSHNFLYDGTNSAIFTDSIGRVGIGMASPGHLLDIAGNTRLFNGNTPTRLRFDTTSTNLADHGGIIFSEGTGGEHFQMYYDGTGGHGSDGALVFTTVSDAEIGYINRAGDMDLAGNLSATGATFTSPVTVGTPTQDPHAATKSYVDSTISGGGGETVGYWTQSGTDIYNSNSGNVGIGTTGPSEKLHVTGNIRFTGNTYKVSDSVSTIIRTTRSDSTQQGLFRTDGWGSFTIDKSLGIGYALGGGTFGAGNLFVSSNVGIGTTNPGAKLDVQGDGTFEGVVRAKNMWIATHPTTGSDRWETEYTSGSTLGGWGYNIHDVSNNVDRFWIERTSGTANIIMNGNVGIGTTAPSYKLDIDGGTGAVADVSGGRIIGLNLIPLSDSEAVPRKYLHDNFVPSAGSGGSGVGSGTSGQTLRHDGSDWVGNSLLYNNGTNVGIGTTGPSVPLEIGGGIGMRFGLYNDTYGLGIQSSLMEFITSGASADFTFGHGTSGSLTRLVTIEGTGNVGIGTVSPGAKLDVSDGSASNEARILLDTVNAGSPQISMTDNYGDNYWAIGADDADNYLKIEGSASSMPTINNNTTAFLTIDTNGNVGIGTTAPVSPLYIKTETSSTEHPEGMLTLENTKTSGESAVRFINSSVASGSAWYAGLNNTNKFQIGYGTANTDGNTKIAIQTNGNVGIGDTTPEQKLDVEGLLTMNSNRIISLGSPIFGPDAATRDYVDQFAHWLANGDDIYNINVGDVGVGTSTPQATLHVAGSGRFDGNLNMNGFNISGVNKIDVGTIDPLYQINGEQYATYAPSIVGGVKEEYVGKAEFKLENNSYSYKINFSELEKGSDLWVWKQVVDYSDENVEVIATPKKYPVPVAYEVKEDSIIFTAALLPNIASEKPEVIEFSFRLVGARHDNQDHPTINIKHRTPNFIFENGIWLK